MFLLAPVMQVLGQTQETAASSAGIDSLTLLLIGILVILVLVLVVALYLLYVIRMLYVKQQQAAGAVEVQESWWKEIQTKLTNAVPVEQEETVMLDHEYDGIQELDNYLPPWWKWLFYFTIAFSVVYLAVYHVFDLAPLQEEEYEIAMRKAEEQKALLAGMVDETNVEIVEDEASLSNGETIYIKNCAPCHQPDGGGSIGPNLTDNYWIHGGSIQDVFAIVKYGVQGRGMRSWESLLSPQDMRDVSSFILVELAGTTPVSPKEPEGELFEPEGTEPTETDTTEVEPAEGETVAKL